jgi:hypothetical protein
MKISSLFSDRTSFESEDAIKNCITKSVNYQKDIESPEKCNGLLIFNTPNQHTWLIASNVRLYCILDDLRKQEPHINWSLGREKIINNQKITIDIKSRDKNSDTGLLDIGEEHKNWLYSKKLFISHSITTMVNKLLTRSMILNEFKS